eukprot:3112180-Rhodomonas_salina.2
MVIPTPVLPVLHYRYNSRIVLPHTGTILAYGAAKTGTKLAYGATSLLTNRALAALKLGGRQVTSPRTLRDL